MPKILTPIALSVALLLLSFNARGQEENPCSNKAFIPSSEENKAAAKETEEQAMKLCRSHLIQAPAKNPSCRAPRGGATDAQAAKEMEQLVSKLNSEYIGSGSGQRDGEILKYCKAFVKSIVSFKHATAIVQKRASQRLTMNQPNLSGSTGDKDAFLQIKSLYTQAADEGRCIEQQLARITRLVEDLKEKSKKVTHVYDGYVAEAKATKFDHCILARSEIARTSTALKRDFGRLDSQFDALKKQVIAARKANMDKTAAAVKGAQEADKRLQGIESVAAKTEKAESRLADDGTPMPTAKPETTPEPEVVAASARTRSLKEAAPKADSPASSGPRLADDGTPVPQFKPETSAAAPKADRLVNSTVPPPDSERWGVAAPVVAAAPAEPIDHTNGRQLSSADYKKMDTYKASIGADIPDRQRYASQWSTVAPELQAASQTNTLSYQAAINDAYNELYGTYAGGVGPSVTQDGIMGSRTRAATSHLSSLPGGEAALRAALIRRGLIPGN